MSDASELPVIIIGGGIGGLAAGVALNRVGIPFQIYERAPEIREVGAGLSLWANAVVALRSLGLDQKLILQGSIVERAITCTSSGKVLSDVSIGDFGRQVDSVNLCAHRADLQNTLLQAIGSDRVHLNASCIGFDQDANGITAKFADGSTVRGSLLVGADGIRSVIREQLHGLSEPRYAGYIAWRGIAHTSHPDLPTDTTKFILGKGTQIGVFHCGSNRTYWFATINSPQNDPKEPSSWKAEALLRFKDWIRLVPEVIEATKDHEILKTGIIDRPPIWPWGKDRVTLLGDAAHSTTPNLGQGACQALEDAVILGDLLRRKGVSPEALREYETTRRERTAMVTNQSWSMGKVFQWQGTFSVWMRNWLMKRNFAQNQGLKLFRELLTYPLPKL